MMWMMAMVAMAPWTGGPSPSAIQATLYQQVIPRTTGQNGYEEYVKAAAMAAHPDIERWQALENPGGQRPQWPTGLRANATYLERNQWVLSRLKPAFELIRQGNTKPVADPREEIKAETLFPELTHFRRLSRAMVGAAYAEFATGQTAQGTDRLLQNLLFGDNVSRTGALINHLVGIAQMSTGFAAFEARLSQLSKSDCQRIVAGTSALLERPSAFARVVAAERDFTLKSVDEMLSKPETWNADDEEDRALAERIRGLSLEDKAAIRRTVLQRLAAEFNESIRAFQGPESRWPLTREEVPPPAVDPTSPEAIADGLVQMLFPVNAQAAVASLRVRTQLRLLRLHAWVLAYRWENNRLPARLADAVPPGEEIDPANNQPFEYVTLPDGYKLVSKGRPETGEVGLRFRRATPSERDQIPPR